MAEERRSRPQSRARVKRAAAARARRLASALNPDQDRERLLDYAKKLDAEADALERQEPVTTHKQEQAQQQEATQAPPEGEPKG